MPFKIVAVAAGPISSTLQFSATISAPIQVKVTSEVSGIAVSLRDDEGQYVRRGQTLVRLDDREGRLLLREAQLAVDRSVADSVRTTHQRRHCWRFG